MCPYEGKQNDFRAFLRQIFEVGKKDIKKGFGKISRLEPLRTRFWAAFPEFFRESGSFLLSAKCRISTGVFVGLADTNSKHRCRRVSPLCDVSDVKTAGKPPPVPGRNHGVLTTLGREKAKHPLQRSGWSFICWISAEHRFLMSHPSCPYGLRECPGRAARETSAPSEYGSDRLR